MQFSTASAAVEPFTSSAHGEALYLVVSTQTEELRRLDPDVDELDTAPRTWTVHRPAASETLDKANTFIVTFSIDGRPTASWYVNTAEGTVELRNATKPETPANDDS